MKYALVEEQSTLRTRPLDSCSVQHLKSGEMFVDVLEAFVLVLEFVAVPPFEKIDETSKSEAPIRKTRGAGCRKGFFPGNRGMSKGAATRISLNEGAFIRLTSESLIKRLITK